MITGFKTETYKVELSTALLSVQVIAFQVGQCDDEVDQDKDQSSSVQETD